MMKSILAIPFLLASTAFAKYEGKKIVFIDSYHEGYAWSDGLVRGLKSGLGDAKADVKIFRMDTKNHPEEDFKKAQGLKAKAFIEENKADVVIVCDDNATKYVLQAHFKDSKIPFVFCGVNWDASAYGLPYKNATGMLELTLIAQLFDALKPYAKGNRLGFLSSDNETERKEGKYAKEKFKLTFTEERYFKTFEEWKKSFVEMQDKVDILYLSNNAGVKDWNDADARAFVLANAKVPVGTSLNWMAPYAVVGYARSPEEQASWAAGTALKILDGAAPSSVSVAENKEVKLHVNLPLAQKLNITFKPAMLKSATIVK